MRISATTLESFRLFMQPEQEWMAEQDLLDTILRKPRAMPERVRIGAAFGAILEQPDRYAVPGGFQCGGYSFDLVELQPALALMDHERGVFEAKASKAYGPHLVVAKADQLVGARLFEHKTTDSSFDADKFAASYQWRYMVDIFEPLSVTYHVFKVDDHGNGVVELRGIDSITYYPYPGLHGDCCELLGRFCWYVRAKGLDAVLEQQAEALA